MAENGVCEPKEAELRQGGPVKRILIVDDDRGVAFSLAHALRPLGQEVQVSTACSGPEALDQVARARFDLVITDIHMPGMDGIVLTQAIRSASRRTEVVWMTGLGCRALQADQHRLAVGVCLDKPFELHTFRDAVRRALAP